MMNENDIGLEWSDIKLFLQIVATGSFGKAAEHAGITQPTISRRIDQLEKRMGKKLFKRTATGAILTDDGAALRSHAERMAVSAGAIEKMSATAEDKSRGRVKIRLPDVLALTIVLPVLNQFLEAHPNLSIVFDFGIIPSDDATPDITLQFIDPSNQGMVRLPVCWVHYSFFGSPEYLEAHGTPKTLAQYATHRLVHHTAYNAHRQGWKKETEAIDTLLEDELILVCDSGPFNVQAIKAGVGLGALPTVVSDAIDGLRPLSLGCAASLPLYMYHDKGADDSTQIAACKQWLLELFSPGRVHWFAEEFIDPYDWFAHKK